MSESVSESESESESCSMSESGPVSGSGSVSDIDFEPGSDVDEFGVGLVNHIELRAVMGPMTGSWTMIFSQSIGVVGLGAGSVVDVV